MTSVEVEETKVTSTATAYIGKAGEARERERERERKINSDNLLNFRVAHGQELGTHIYSEP